MTTKGKQYLKKPKGIYEASQIGWTISPRSKVRGEKFPKYLKFHHLSKPENY